jgi:hypothetical protein
MLADEMQMEARQDGSCWLGHFKKTKVLLDFSLLAPDCEYELNPKPDYADVC